METLISLREFVLEQKQKLSEVYGNATNPLDLEHARINFIHNVSNFTSFISQQLEIWQFVPCKLENGFWVVLTEPNVNCLKGNGSCQCGEEQVSDCREWKNEYRIAKELCLFEGFYFVKKLDDMDNGNKYFRFNYKGKLINIEFNKTVEDLIYLNPDLTQTAKNQILK